MCKYLQNVKLSCITSTSVANNYRAFYFKQLYNSVDDGLVFFHACKDFFGLFEVVVSDASIDKAAISHVVWLQFLLFHLKKHVKRVVKLVRSAICFD